MTAENITPTQIPPRGIPGFKQIMDAARAASSSTPLKLSVEQAASIFALDSTDREEVDVNEGMHLVVDRCIAGLAGTGLVFDRGSILVCIDHDNSIHTFTKATVKFALSKLFAFKKTTWNPQAKQLVTQPAAIPDYLGDTITSLTKWIGMPVVDALTDHPVITTDDRLIMTGYDRETRVFGRFDASTYLIPAEPTYEDATEALVLVRRLLQTFDFASKEDEAAALALLFTAVSRPVVPTALLGLISASMPGSGKGYLAGLACWLAKAATPVARQLQDDPAEMHKALMSVLSGMDAVCFFDEVATNDIDLPCLRTFATAPVYGGRCLGYIRDISFPNRAFALATGNNIAATQDFARRTLNLYLNPQVENPSLRRFEYVCPDASIRSAAEDVRRNREQFISAILTMQRAFLQSQRRDEIEVVANTLGGFNEWETLCRLPVLWLTGVDPAAKSIEAMKENAAKDELAAIMAAWQATFGSTPTSPTEAIRNANFAEAAEENIKRRPGSHVNNIVLGLWLKKHKQQITGGHMFDIDMKDAATKTAYWVVRSVGG